MSVHRTPFRLLPNINNERQTPTATTTAPTDQSEMPTTMASIDQSKMPTTTDPHVVFLNYRKACDLDYNELKMFVSETFAIDFEIDNIIKNIIENPLTVVTVPLHKKNGLFKERSPVVLYGIVSILDLSQTNSCYFLKEHILNLSQKYSSEEFKKTVAELFSNTKNNLKLLFNERKEFISPGLCPYLLSHLNYIKENFGNDDHFFYVSKVFKATKRNTRYPEIKSKLWLNSEDFVFADEATDYFEYAVNPSIVSGFPDTRLDFVPDDWNPKDYTNAVPWRRIYLIPLNRLDTIYKNLKDKFND